MSSSKKGYEDCIISQVDGHLFYNRYFHPSQKSLCQLLEKRYGKNTCAAIYPSGLCAIDSVLQILMIDNTWNNANIVYGDELYCDTPRVIKYLSNKFLPMKLQKIKAENDSNVLDTFKNKVNRDSLTILFIESCSNPNGKIFNFELLSEIRKMFSNPSNLKVIVDNSWITSAIFNPLEFSDVDIVVNSLTKYYGGDRSGIMGAAITKNAELGNNLLEYCKVKGLHVCPLYCDEVINNINLMNTRIAKTSKMTQELAIYLEKEKLLKVNHPSLSSHPSNYRAKKYYGNLGPSVLTFEVPLSRTQSLEWMRSSNYDCSTSFGASDSRFDQWPSSKGKKSFCRFAIGYDDTIQNIKKEFDNLLLKLNKDNIHSKV